MRAWTRAATVACAAVALLYLGNASWIWGRPGKADLVTHLGMSQHFDERGLSLYDCKGDRMLPPTHAFLENTIAGVGRALELGADIADIDIQPTRDGDYVVFHDAKVDCRTDGHGSPWNLTVAELKKLDIGYGYTADKGRTFPFRGKFVGAMPTLAEMLDAFPGRRFMLIMKSNDPREGELLFAYLQRHHVDPNRIQVMGGDKPAARLHELAPRLRVGSERMLKTCLKHYLALGWSGTVPGAWRNPVVMVPFNYRRAIWGWPNLFVQRMARANSVVILVGDYRRHSDKPGMNMLDTPAQLATLPRDYAGQIFTSRIEILGPAARARGMLR
jgi:glycerophosphoryl diester phosphodiesterase